MKNWILAASMLAVVLSGLLLAACDDKIKTSDEDIKRLQYKQLRAMLEDPKKPTVLIDPRIEKYYNAGHIEGAINIPLSKIIAGDPSLANFENIVVYGTTWTDYMATAADKRLMALGYKNVYEFQGGVELWKSEGGRVIVTVPATTPTATPKN